MKTILKFTKKAFRWYFDMYAECYGERGYQIY